MHPYFLQKGCIMYRKQKDISARGVYYNLDKSPWEYTDELGNIFKFSSQKKLDIFCRKVKEKQMLEGIISPTKKPDIDNIAKSILDALNKFVVKEKQNQFFIEMENLKKLGFEIPEQYSKNLPKIPKMVYDKIIVK